MRLHTAALSGQAEEVSRLITQGCKIDERTEHGDTALAIACQSEGNIECVRLLLKALASPNQKNSRGVSPLHDACRNADLECVQLLVGVGADPHMKTVAGESAFDVAAQSTLSRPPRSPIVGSEVERLLADLEDAPLICADVGKWPVCCAVCGCAASLWPC